MGNCGTLGDILVLSFYEVNAVQKADAMRAVERFNKAAAARGERPTGL